MLRSKLPASPYRDDVPHITLLRGVSSAGEMSDEALVHDMRSLLAISNHLPLYATARQIVNKSDELYRSSSVVPLDASDDLLAYRTRITTTLAKHHYAIEAQELTEYAPHITIRLGVPLEGSNYKLAQKLFEGEAISFDQWFLFRLVLIDGKRAMHEVQPPL